jgi:hypothetical protein
MRVFGIRAPCNFHRLFPIAIDRLRQRMRRVVCYARGTV